MSDEVPEHPTPLQPISRFTVAPQEGHYAGRFMLLLDGQSTGRLVPGARVEAQFSYGDRWLVLLGNDCMFDGYLCMLLLGPTLRVIDQRELGVGWGNAGFVMRLRVVAPSTVEFSFFGDDCWRLTILPAPRFMWIDWGRRETRQWGKLFSRRWMALDQIA